MEEDMHSEHSPRGFNEEKALEQPIVVDFSCRTKWNEDGVVVFRYLAVNYSFIVMGMNDAAFGALIPYLELYYNLNYTVVSLIFLAPAVGYACAALLNNAIHKRLGQRGIAVIAPTSKVCVYVVCCVHPPYPVLPIILCLAGLANGLEDSAWNAWVGGGLQRSNELLGVLHGCYGLGATLSPLIASALVTKGNLPWYTFYYIMVALAALEVLLCAAAFREASGASYRRANPDSSSPDGQSQFKEALLNHVTWLCSLFLLGYVGIEVSLGGWLPTFLRQERNGQSFASGLVATGFWLGITLGRVILGFVTGRLGEKVAISVYLLLSCTLELCFWLIPTFTSSAVCAGFLGFFLGPMFPAAVVAATKLLPKRIHVSAIGFAAAFGGAGAAALPFLVGAIAEAKGVQVLQPIILAMLIVILALWCLLPGGFRKAGLDEVGRQNEDWQAGSSGTEQSWLVRGVGVLKEKIAGFAKKK